MKILYVDDEIINLQLFQINFEGKFEVLTALDGIEGLKILEEHGDITNVISDMRMPQMTGLQFIKKAKENHPNIKFYILTGYEITPEIQDALDTHLIIQYFKKPFSLKEIEKTILKPFN